MIRIYCDAADALLKETQTLTSGMLNYPTVVLTFSHDWDGFGKAAVVKAGEVVKDVLITNNKFVIPAECLAESGVNLIVGISGTDGMEVIPTIWCSCGEIFEGTDVNEADNLGEATPSLVDQMLAIAQQIQDYAEDLDENVIRSVVADTTLVDQYGTAAVSITDSGPGEDRTLTFSFANLKGNGITSILFTASGENKGRVQVKLDDGTITNYDGIKEALASIASMETDIEAAEAIRVAAEELRVSAEEGRVEAEEHRAAEWEDWGDIVSDAEAWADGTRGGADITSSDPAYNKHSKHFSLVSEGYALGKQNGVDVTSGSPYYENNAEYMKDAAAAYTLQADSFSGESAAWATGSYDGGSTPVPSTAPQHHNNAKYYKELAEEAAATFATDTTLSVSGKAADAKVTGDKFTQLSTAVNNISSNTQNIVSNVLTGVGIGSTGILTSNSSFNMVVAPVEQGKTYYVSTNETDLVCAFYNANPTIGSNSYNGQRIVQTDKTITSPINGYIAFRVSPSYSYPQIEKGTVSTPYVPDKSADDFVARTQIYVTPEYFGAVGDGVTDDTIAIKKAISTGRPVYFAKMYAVTESLPLPNYASICGSSMQTATIIFAQDCGFLLEGRYITIENLFIKGNGGSCIADVSNTYTTYMLNVRNVCIEGFDKGIQFGATTWNCTFQNIRINNCNLGIDSLSSNASGMLVTFINLHFNHCNQNVNLNGFKCTFIGCNFGVDKYTSLNLSNAGSYAFICCNFECDTKISGTNLAMFELACRSVSFKQCMFKIKADADTYVFRNYSGLSSLSFLDCVYDSTTGNELPDNRFFSASQSNTAVYGAIAFNGGNVSIPRPSYSSAQVPNWIDRERNLPIRFNGTSIDKTKLYIGEVLYSITNDCLCTYDGTNIVKVSDGTVIV